MRSPWLADRGDGTFQNPVLFADYSDPDVIRVGDDYWMTASSFCHVPGLPILLSRDLVNWTLVNHALPTLTPHEHFSTPRHGEGVWAPALRHHAGNFWIFYPDPDFGLYVITASDPRGAWSAPHLLKPGKGLIDPCPFWDDDGHAFLIHAWAKSRAGVSNLLTLHRMSPDGARLLDTGKTVIDGNALPGWHTLEGPKLYKRAGWYFIFAPAGGVGEGYQAVFRSREIFGPYENRIVLEQGTTAINGPHQGAWVDTSAGENWFFHFQEIPAYGRVVHLQPLTWREGSWPAIGINRDDFGKGEPALAHPKPALPAQPFAAPATSDEFAPKLGLQWQWQANPRPEWASLTACPGALRLACTLAPNPGSHWHTPHLLLQKFPAPAFSATTKLSFAPRAANETAGLIIFGNDYAWLGLRQTSAGIQLALVKCLGASSGEPELEIVTVPVHNSEILLRATVSAGARCHFSYSLDGSSFTELGDSFQACSSKWVGAKVGLFASASHASTESGYADFAWFRVDA